MNRILILLVVAGLFACSGKDANKNNVTAGNKDTAISNPNFVSQTERPGYEYLSDSVYKGDFVFFDNESQNDPIVWSQMRKNDNDRKYHNHFLYCLDTISDYQKFICCAAEYFEKISPFPWGVFYSDCETAMKKKVLPEKIQIIKSNSIRGASLIVNSCLFNTDIPYWSDKEAYSEDLFSLYWKYMDFEKEISDSVFYAMCNDMVRLCTKYQSISTSPLFR